MIDSRRVIAVIPARAGSRGLPGKNMRSLGGKPMAAWTLEAALASAHIDRIVVSTDDAALGNLARGMGIVSIDRPHELAGPQASVIDAIAHVLTLDGQPWDYVILLQPTSPLRSVDDIDAALELCHGRSAPAVFSVSLLPKPSGFYGRLTGDDFQPHQNDGEPAMLNGAVYVGRTERLFADQSFQPDGAVPYVMPPSRGVDVDTLMDFALCEALLPLLQAGRTGELDQLRR